MGATVGKGRRFCPAKGLGEIRNQGTRKVGVLVTNFTLNIIFVIGSSQRNLVWKSVQVGYIK